MDERGHLIWKPLRNSLSIAAGYALIGVIYILYSDQVAVGLARDMEMLAAIQRVKGMAYVLTTALLLGVICFVLFRRVYRSLLISNQAQAALVAAERRVSAAMVSLSLAHDVNNQLQVLSGVTELLHAKRPLLGDDGARLMDLLDASIAKLLAMLADMRAGGRRSAAMELKQVDLVAYIEESLHYLRRHDRIKKCTVRVIADGNPSMVVSPGVLYDALLNLVLNAGDALRTHSAGEDEGQIQVHIRPDGNHTIIEVHDNGPGVAPHMESTLFQPFRTSKQNGTGLGLVAVKACADLHNGQVHYERSPLGGACFRMSLASIDQQAAS